MLTLGELLELNRMAVVASGRRGQGDIHDIVRRGMTVAVASMASDAVFRMLAQMPVGDDVGCYFEMTIDAEVGGSHRGGEEPQSHRENRMLEHYQSLPDAHYFSFNGGLERDTHRGLARFDLYPIGFVTRIARSGVRTNASLLRILIWSRSVEIPECLELFDDFGIELSLRIIAARDIQEVLVGRHLAKHGLSQQ